MPIHIHIQNQSYLKHIFLGKEFLRSVVPIPGIHPFEPSWLSTGKQRIMLLRRCPGRAVMPKH
jgi:hypothetical protein